MLMQDCLPEVSPYDYEEITFLYQQMALLDGGAQESKKALLVLDVLADYTRTNPPDDKELALVNKAACDKRFPFHTLMLKPVLTTLTLSSKV
jgi:hypothetical protein